jgi:hypothetical protein
MKNFTEGKWLTGWHWCSWSIKAFFNSVLTNHAGFIASVMDSNFEITKFSFCHVVCFEYFVHCCLNLTLQRDITACTESCCQKHVPPVTLCRHNKQNIGATRGKCQFHLYWLCLCRWWYNSHAAIYSTHNPDAIKFNIFVLCASIGPEFTIFWSLIFQRRV